MRAWICERTCIILLSLGTNHYHVSTTTIMCLLSLSFVYYFVSTTTRQKQGRFTGISNNIADLARNWVSVLRVLVSHLKAPGLLFPQRSRAQRRPVSIRDAKLGARTSPCSNVNVHASRSCPI